MNAGFMRGFVSGSPIYSPPSIDMHAATRAWMDLGKGVLQEGRSESYYWRVIIQSAADDRCYIHTDITPGYYNLTSHAHMIFL